MHRPCFKNLQGQGLVWCCLFVPYMTVSARFSSDFSSITLLTSYHWTKKIWGGMENHSAAPPCFLTICRQRCRMFPAAVPATQPPCRTGRRTDAAARCQMCIRDRHRSMLSGFFPAAHPAAGRRQDILQYLSLIHIFLVRFVPVPAHRNLPNGHNLQPGSDLPA